MEEESKKLKSSLWPMEICHPWCDNFTIHINKDGVLVEPRGVEIWRLFMLQSSPECLKFEARDGFTSEEILQEIITVILDTPVPEKVYMIEPQHCFLCFDKPTVIHYEHRCRPKTYGDAFRVLGKPQAGIIFHYKHRYELRYGNIEPVTSLAHRDICPFHDFIDYYRVVDFVPGKRYISMWYCGDDGQPFV